MTQWRVVSALLLCAAYGWAQTESQAKAEPHGPVLESAAKSSEPWKYSLTVDGYIISGEDGYATPSAVGLRRRLDGAASRDRLRSHRGSGPCLALG